MEMYKPSACGAESARNYNAKIYTCYPGVSAKKPFIVAPVNKKILGSMEKYNQKAPSAV